MNKKPLLNISYYQLTPEEETAFEELSSSDTFYAVRPFLLVKMNFPVQEAVFSYTPLVLFFFGMFLFSGVRPALAVNPNLLLKPASASPGTLSQSPGKLPHPKAERGPAYSSSNVGPSTSSYDPEIERSVAIGRSLP